MLYYPFGAQEPFRFASRQLSINVFLLFKALQKSFKYRGTYINYAHWRLNYERASTYLFSRVVTNQVFSAQLSLTSVFGMGTGGT